MHEQSVNRFSGDCSEDDDKLFESSHLALLHGQKDSLALRTAGYQWFGVINVCADKIIRINPKDKYTVSESPEFNLGKVSNIWAVNISESLKSGLTLKERAKERMAHFLFQLHLMTISESKVPFGFWKKDYYCNCTVAKKQFSMLL